MPIAVSKDGRATSSVGLGGKAPLGRTYKLEDTVLGRQSDSKSCSEGAARYWVMPGRCLSIEKICPKVGLRMSRPTITVFLSIKAKLAAKLVAVNDLPSPELVEVKRMTF